MQTYQQQSGLWALQADDGTIRNYATEQEAKMASQPTAMDTFTTKYEALRTATQDQFNKLHEMERFLRANPQIATETNAADNGALIGGSLMSKEQVQTALLLFGNGIVFASAEIAAGLGFSNEDAVLRQ